MISIDEINKLQSELIETLSEKIRENPQSSEVEDLIDEYLEYAFAFGSVVANEELGTNYEIDRQIMGEAMMLKVDGKDYRERINEYRGNPDKLIRVADTEGHRLFNTAKYDIGKKSGAKKKWNTMLDDKVRFTHDYLEGDAVEMDEVFTTIDGDFARFPGDFALAENNINCRCFITLEGK